MKFGACVTLLVAVCLATAQSAAAQCPTTPCPVGQVCIGGICITNAIPIPGCSRELPCPNGQICQSNGVCASPAIPIPEIPAEETAAGSSGSGSGSGSTGSAGPLPVGQCSAEVACPAPQECVSGTCFSPAVPVIPDIPDIPTCSPKIPCAAGRVCLGGVCVVPETPSSGGDESTGRACVITMDCPFGQRCHERMCKPFEMPSTDCKKDGVSTCATTEECFFGVCLPKRAEFECEPSCRAAYGEVCNVNLGRCVIDQTAAPLNCANMCDSITCRPPLFPGMPVTCVGGTPCVDNACAVGNVCVQGYCTRCGTLCSAVSDSLFAELFNSGFDAESFTVRNASEVASDIANGALSVAADMLMQLDAAMGGLNRLDFNAAGAGGAAAQIKNGQQVRLDNIMAAAANGRLLLGAGSQLRSNLTVSSASGFTLSMAGTIGERAFTQFNHLNLSGPLNVAGDANSEFVFPAVASQSIVQGSGIVQVTGGLRLRGNAGAIPLSLGAGDSSAVVDSQLESAGSVLGNKATLVVRGLIAFSGALVEPLVRLHQGATASFRPAAAGTLRAGNFSFAANAQGSFAETRLVINATDAAGQGVVFQHISNCPAGTTIVYNVAGSADAKVKAGLTLFKYAVSTYANVDSFRCGIKVCGDDGNGCVAVTNPNTVSVGRRLLGTAAEASFEPNQLTVSGKDTGAAASVQVGVATIAAIVAALMAIVRM